ncbi:MAG: HEAT repeat domain-containing protein [Spirochaetota bacterium]
MSCVRAIAVMSLLFAICSASSISAETVPPAPADPVASRAATIRFGIESELLDLFKALGSEKEARYNDEILALFIASSSPKLRTAALDLFRSLSWKGAEEAALDCLKGRDNEDPLLVAGALSYLAEIKSSKALAYAQSIIDENNKALLPALVTLLGRAGGEREEDILLAWIKGDSPNQQLRESAIRALGDIGSAKATESLIKIVSDAAAPRFERVFAAEALSKIGQKSALGALIKVANGEDPTVRAAAIEALGSFDAAEAERALLEALRDSFAKSRIAACKALGKKRLKSAIPNLEYKASNDPEKSVKVEALRALGEIGGTESFSFILSLLENRKGESSQRSLAFGILARKDPGSSLDALGLILAEEAKTADRTLYTSLVREVAAAGEIAEIAPLALFIMADKDYLMRLGGLEWAKTAKSPAAKTVLENLAARDPNEAVRKKANDILGLYK